MEKFADNMENSYLGNCTTKIQKYNEFLCKTIIFLPLYSCI